LGRGAPPGLRLATKVGQAFSFICHSAVGAHLDLQRKRHYVGFAPRCIRRCRQPAGKGLKMSSSTFTIHAGCTTVKTAFHAAKRWQGFCHSKRM
jgi:hypothetical protein